MNTTPRRLCTCIALGLASLSGSAAAADEELDVLLFSMPYTQGLARLADDFEAETGIVANIDVVGQDVFENRITLSFTGGGDDIDVVHSPVIQVQRWVEAGWLAPLTGQIAAMEGRDDLLAGPLDAYAVNDEHLGGPVLRRDRADGLSLGHPVRGGLRWTARNLAGAARGREGHRQRRDGRHRDARRSGQGFNMFVFPMIARSYGGYFFADYPDDLTPAIDTPENLEALELYMTLLNGYGPDGVGNFNFNEVAAAAQAGQVAMIVDGTSIVSQVVDPAASNFADEFVIALPPGGPEGRSPAIAVHGLGVPAGAADVDASFRFIEWATSEATLHEDRARRGLPGLHARERRGQRRREGEVRRYPGRLPRSPGRGT